MAQRNPALLEMARGRPCLLCIHRGIQQCTPGSTVAAHSNESRHGKGMGRKAEDFYSAWLGDFHHRWLDQGDGSRAQREQAFMAAHLLQVLEWRRIAQDPAEPEKYRRAAHWAMDRLNATPVASIEEAP